MSGSKAREKARAEKDKLGLVAAPLSPLLGQYVQYRGRQVTVLGHVETSIPVAHLRDGAECMAAAFEHMRRLKMNISAALTLVVFQEDREDREDRGASEEGMGRGDDLGSGRREREEGAERIDRG